jgi:broad specificity phosphatase PhoE
MASETAGASVAATPKRVALIRHGQGWHNMAWRGGGLAWLGSAFLQEDPMLTPIGQQQADRVRERIRAAAPVEPLSKVEVVLCSPLSRTIETATRIFGSGPADAQHPRLVLSPLCAERCLATCDRGLRKAELVRRWPHVSSWEGASELADIWWPADRSWSQEYSPLDRMRALKEALVARPESTLCVVGHAGIFGVLTGRRMANCEVLWCDLLVPSDGSEPQLVPIGS